MMGMSPWLGRLILLLALINIDHASGRVKKIASTAP